MLSTRPLTRLAATVERTPAAHTDAGDPVTAAALRRAEQRRDRGDLAGAYGWAAYAHQLCQHQARSHLGLRLRVAQVLAPLALRVGDTALATAAHDDLATLTTATGHEPCLHTRATLACRPPRQRETTCH